MYSFSMIFYYLLDGKPPWPTLNGLVAVRKAANDGDRPPIPRGWDERLQSLLQECWSENPAVRPPFRRILKVVNEYASKSFDSSIIVSSSSHCAHPCAVLLNLQVMCFIRIRMRFRLFTVKSQRTSFRLCFLVVVARKASSRSRDSCIC